MLFLTGVAKRYDRHTIFETGVADATPATPLPALLLPNLVHARVSYLLVRSSDSAQKDFKLRYS